MQNFIHICQIYFLCYLNNIDSSSEDPVAAGETGLEAVSSELHPAV